MNQIDLEYFVSIAEHRNLSRAADSLFISQSALSQYLKKLEASVGASLFRRNGRELLLTDAGKIFYTGAVEMMHIHDRMLEDIRLLTATKQARISVGVTGSNTLLFASQITSQLQKNYPDYQIRFIQDEMSRLCEMVRAGKLDCAIGAINFQSGVLKLDLARHPLALFVSPSNPSYARFREDIPLDLTLLENQRFILLHPSMVLRRLTDQFFNENHLSPTVFAESHDYETIYNIVNQSDALTLLAARNRVKMPEAKCILLPNSPCYELGVIYSEASVLKPYVRDFLALAEENRHAFD